MKDNSVRNVKIKHSQVVFDLLPFCNKWILAGPDLNRFIVDLFEQDFRRRALSIYLLHLRCAWHRADQIE